MCQPECPRWLTALRDAVSAGYPLTGTPPTDECRRLARGFVCCNAVIDLADFFSKLLQGQPVVLANGITYRDVRDWLVNRNVTSWQGLWPSLVDASAVAALLLGPDGRHPWRQIHHWLALEACLRFLHDDASAPTPATPIARWTFQGILAGLHRAPLVCRQRSRQLLRAFNLWWVCAAERLTGLLAADLWPKRATLTALPDLAASLRGGLGCEKALVRLVELKNNQLTTCRGRLNRSLISPNPQRLADLGQRLERLPADGAGLRWEGQDRRSLALLLLWVVGEGQEGRLGPHGAKTAPLWELALEPTPRMIARSAADRAQLQTAWAALETVLASVGWPPEGWGVDAPMPPGWLGQTASRLLAAWQGKRDLRFQSADSRALGSLLLWLAAHGLAKRIVAGGNLRQPPLEPLAFEAATQTIPWGAPSGLPALVSLWALLERIVRTRGLPANWGTSRPVADLFFCPLPVDFTAWYNTARTVYGFPPCANP